MNPPFCPAIQERTEHNYLIFNTVSCPLVNITHSFLSWRWIQKEISRNASFLVHREEQKCSYTHIYGDSTLSSSKIFPFFIFFHLHNSSIRRCLTPFPQNTIVENISKYLFPIYSFLQKPAHTLPIIPETDLILIHMCYVFKSIEIYKNLFQFKYFSY